MNPMWYPNKEGVHELINRETVSKWERSKGCVSWLSKT